jgi:hypothetical protein
MQAMQVALETFAREASIPVSTVALGGLMQRLFADELAAWQEAQRAGKSLGEHLAGRPAAVRSADERTATDAFGPTRRRVTTGRKWARWLALTAFAAVFALAGGLTAKRWKTEAEQAPAPPVALPAVVGPNSTATTPPPAMKPRPATKIVAAEVVPTPTAAAPSHSRRVKRARAESATPPPAPVSRLHSWDPDSPKAP